MYIIHIPETEPKTKISRFARIAAPEPARAGRAASQPVGWRTLIFFSRASRGRRPKGHPCPVGRPAGRQQPRAGPQVGRVGSQPASQPVGWGADPETKEESRFERPAAPGPAPAGCAAGRAAAPRPAGWPALNNYIIKLYSNILSIRVIKHCSY